ncbi:PTPRQ-like protein, partial [Mya arenaria]
SFSFQNNDTTADPNKTYNVEIKTTDVRFSPKCLSTTENQGTTSCSILRNESHLKILELESGSSYEIKIFSQIKFKEKYTRSKDFQHFVNYTVPELPTDIEIPLGSITHDSFIVSFENNDKNRFTYWSVVVINSETGEWVAEDTSTSDVKSQQITTNITSSTFYMVQVQTHVLLQSSDLFNKSFYTRPRRPNSGVLVKENVTESEITLYIKENEEERFDHYSLIITSSDEALFTLSGPSNASCEQTGNNCTFHRSANFSTVVTVKRLTSGTFYPLHLFSRFKGLPSLESQNCSSYTAPSMPSLLDFPKEYIKENSFEVHITVPNKRFFNLSIDVCRVSKETTCITEVLNNTYSYANESVTKNLTVKNLTLATNYSITAKTGITNEVKSVTSFIYYMQTAPVGPSVLLKSVNETSIELDVTGNTELTIDKFCIKLNSSSCYEIYTDTPGSITVSNLQAGQSYSLKVYSVLNDIESVRFKEIRTYTKPNPVNVDKVNTSVVTNSTLTVVWSKPPAYTNGYETQWNCESPNIGTGIDKHQIEKGTQLSSTAVNLDPGTFCNVTITAYIINYDNATLQATSVFKEISSSTLEEAPGIPESIENTDLTSRTSTIELQEPNKRNGILRRYDIWVLNNETSTCEQLMTYKCKDCDESSPNASNSVPDTCNKSHSEMFSKTDASLSWNIQQLHPFREYSANVVVYTTKPGSVSTIMFETREDVPGKPVDLNASTTHDSFTLQWNPPEERNGKVINYTVKATYYEQVCRGIGDLYVNSYGVEFDPVTKFTQNGLHAYWQYNLTVEATNAIATGKPSDLISVRTKETNPGSVQQLNYQDVSSKSVCVSWTKPCFANGILTGYSVTITKLLSEGQEESSYTKAYTIDVANESTSIYSLLPYRNYKVEVYALNSAGDGELSNVLFRTKIDYPEKPVKVSTKNKTSSSLLIEWEKADHFNDTLATECNVPGLDAYWEYEIVVDAVTFEEGHDELIESSQKKTFRTADAVPGRVAQFDVTPEENVLEERNFHIDLKKPIDRDLNGVLRGFIQARTSVGPGAAVHKEITVNPGAPIKVDESKTPLMLKASVSVDNDESQIAIALPLAQFLCNSSNGQPTMWGIVVAEADEAAEDSAFAGKRDDFQKKIDDMYKTWFQVDGLNNIPPYIATKPNWRPPCTNGNRRKRFATDGSNIFVIGHEECYGISVSKDYCNGPLPDGRSFKVKSFVCTDYGCSESVYSQPIETVVLMIFFMRKRQATCFLTGTESITHTSSDRFVEMGAIQTKAQPGAVYLQGPVKLTEFPAFVEKMHNDNDLIFADAYKFLNEYYNTFVSYVTRLLRNRALNTLVQLPNLRTVERKIDTHTVFHGYTSPREYIATQGPIQATFDDFWRMVWEQNVDMIVMLTKLVENGRIKCDKYWPDVNKPKYYGDLLVSVASESKLSDYILRIFEIKLNGERRSVRQFAYFKWPDMGCPEFPEMLLELLEAVKVHHKRQHDTRDKGPMAVHCSAGVGRTGTFIAVDHLLQHIRHHDDVDVYKLVLDMNNHRCNMVQTEDQFIFIHECLKACITSDRNYEEVEEHMYEQLTIMGRQHLQC